MERVTSLLPSLRLVSHVASVGCIGGSVRVQHDRHICETTSQVELSYSMGKALNHSFEKDLSIINYPLRGRP